MNSSPLFSVITVCYNAAPLLVRTIGSVLSQSYPHIQYIVIDGGSGDDTPVILEQYRESIDHLVSEPDQGIYDAMNKGLALAEGDYICFMNAGDTFASPHTIEQAMGCVSPDYIPDVIYGETDLYDLQGNYLRPRRLHPPKHLTHESFLGGMLVCHQSFYPRREITSPYCLKYKYSSDYDWCLRILKSSCRTHSMGTVVTHYLCEGATTRHRWASLRERFCIMRSHFGLLRTLLAHAYFVVRLPIQKLFPGS